MCARVCVCVIDKNEYGLVWKYAWIFIYTHVIVLDVKCTLPEMIIKLSCLYGRHSTGPSSYSPWVCICRKICINTYVLMVFRCIAQSNVIHKFWRASCEFVPKMFRKRKLYSWQNDYHFTNFTTARCRGTSGVVFPNCLQSAGWW